MATDCGALNDADVKHNYSTAVCPSCNTPALRAEKIAELAVKAGVNSNCGSYLGQHMPAVMAKKMVPQTVLLESTARLLTVRFKLGLFEPNNSAVPKYGLEHVDSVAHRALALKQARQGIVLLQNKPFQQQHGQHEQHKEQTRRQPPKSILPLDVKAIKRVAMIGPNANASLNLLSGYHGTPPFLVTPLQAMQAAFGAGAVGYAVGCNVTNVSWGGIGGG